jgi:hypothetical protein
MHDTDSCFLKYPVQSVKDKTFFLSGSIFIFSASYKIMKSSFAFAMREISSTIRVGFKSDRQ